MSDLKTSIEEVFNNELSNLETHREEIVEAIATIVATWLVQDLPTMIYHLYRIDIEEEKVNEIMRNGSSMPIKIATLIYERQLNKYRYKHSVHTPRGTGDLKW